MILPKLDPIVILGEGLRRRFAHRIEGKRPAWARYGENGSVVDVYTGSVTPADFANLLRELEVTDLELALAMVKGEISHRYYLEQHKA